VVARKIRKRKCRRKKQSAASSLDLSFLPQDTGKRSATSADARTKMGRGAEAVALGPATVKLAEVRA
jgi:hypothetical protein